MRRAIYLLLASLSLSLATALVLGPAVGVHHRGGGHWYGANKVAKRTCVLSSTVGDDWDSSASEADNMSTKGAPTTVEEDEERSTILTSNYENENEIPGKIIVDDETLARQQVELEAFARQLRKERLDREAEENRWFGLTPRAEQLNGRLAMFFITVGLLTEYWTGESLPQQIETMLRVLGILPLDYESML